MLLVSFLVMGCVAGGFLLNWYTHRSTQTKLLNYGKENQTTERNRKKTKNS